MRNFKCHPPQFDFGRNWTRFLSSISESRILEAKNSLRKILELSNLSGKTFLDIGSGSGLSSLAAVRLGAKKVHSFDANPLSVACTRELKRRYFPEAGHWTIEEGSILDQSYLISLNQWDIVYSWGVLHHTGNLWPALHNVVTLMASSALLCIAIYNDQQWKSEYWRRIKLLYNSNRFLRWIIILFHIPYLIGGRFVVRFLSGRLHLERGMSLWWDMLDWLGGYPFEVASPESVIDYFHRRNLELVSIKRVGKRHGCNEFVFKKK